MHRLYNVTIGGHDSSARTRSWERAVYVAVLRAIRTRTGYPAFDAVRVTRNGRTLYAGRLSVVWTEYRG